MRKILFIIAFILAFSPLYGQEKDNLLTHQLSLDFGSLRNRYLYPITNLRYNSPLLTKVNLKFSARLRSYGTLYIFTKSAYDFTPQVEYFFTKKTKSLYFSAGLGLDNRIRLLQDERSSAISSAEPIISGTMYVNYKKLFFTIPLWTRFYSNGITFSILPEASYRVSNRISAFIRYELSYLSIFNKTTHEWRQDNFVGATILF